MRSDVPVQGGDFLEVELSLPNDNSPVSIELAVVRWTQEGEFGLDFLRINPDEQARLRRFVKTPGWLRRLISRAPRRRGTDIFGGEETWD